VTIYPLVLKIYLNAQQFTTDQVDMSTNVRHNHSSFELQYFWEGDDVIETGNSVIPVSQHSLFLISPGEYHYQSMNEKMTRKYCIRFDYMIIDDSVNILQVPWCTEVIKVLSESPYLFIENCTCLCEYFNRMREEITRKELLYTERIKNILSDFFIEMFRFINSEFCEHSPYEQNAEREDLVLDLFFEETYWIHSLTAEDMAKHICISVRHLNRLLKKHFNLTYRQKLTTTRIEVAKGLLKDTERSMEEIADKTGFSSVEYFYKCFKQSIGVPPGEYRKLSKTHKP